MSAWSIGNAGGVARSKRQARRAGLRVALAGSGGGHVRQLLDLERVWSNFEAFFVTEDTPLGRSIAERHTAHFVPHFAHTRTASTVSRQVGQTILPSPARQHARDHDFRNSRIGTPSR